MKTKEKKSVKTVFDGTSRPKYNPVWQKISSFAIGVFLVSSS